MYSSAKHLLSSRITFHFLLAHSSFSTVAFRSLPLATFLHNFRLPKLGFPRFVERSAITCCGNRGEGSSTRSFSGRLSTAVRLWVSLFSTSSTRVLLVSVVAFPTIIYHKLTVVSIWHYQAHTRASHGSHLSCSRK